jgi:hypothetical protein
LVITCTLLHACAGQLPTRLPLGMVKAESLPPTPPGLDHYISWVPLAQAQTASVAEAMTHISLSKAREHLSHDLCNGDRVSRGAVVEKYGPIAVRTPASMGAYPAWYYRISQQPGLTGCRNEQSSRLYRALQTRLPPWISVSPGDTAETHTLGLHTSP